MARLAMLNVVVLGAALAVALAATLGGCATTRAHDGWSHYGAQMRDHAPTVALGTVSGTERDVAIEGEITDVCIVKGCWMWLRSDEGDRIFVRFRNYGFFVPMNSVGHRAVARGDVVRRTVSVEMLRHYAEDAGQTPAEIATITEPETRLEMIADGVWIEGDGLDAPFRP